MSSKSKRIKRQLRNIARGSRQRMPLWTVMDIFTCDLMRDAAKLIQELEDKLKAKKP